MKKLYKVSVEFTFYAEGDSEDDAKFYATDALSDLVVWDVADAEEIGAAGTLHDCQGDDLIYGAERDTTLDEALTARGLPTVGNRNAAWQRKVFGRPNPPRPT